MDSPLDVVEGSFQSAILTTFTLDLEFVDHWVIPRLTSAGVRNIVILCDPGQLIEHLIVSGSRRAGQHYSLVALSTAGVFHPKVIYLSGPDEQRACVSSANLTAAGQLRNLETAAVLSSKNDGHATALREIRQFLRELTSEQPAHALEACLAALEWGTDTSAVESPTAPKFVHNLSTPLLDQLPGPATAGTAPFASRNALRALADGNGQFRVVMDEARRDAIDQARALDLELHVARFIDDGGTPRRRAVHGKAIWHDEGWCLVGSPNLTGPALLETASSGNIEAAVVFPTAAFDLPDYQRAPVPPPQSNVTPTRHRSGDDQEFLFHAILDGTLRVEGIPDGVEVQYATSIEWVTLGTVHDGTVEVGAPVAVGRVRSLMSDGRIALAIVHRPAYLRARRRTPPSRSSEAVSAPPLDLQGVRELEEVLGNLYSLDDLAAEELARLRATGGSKAADDADAPIETWKPARPQDDPRIPDLYRQVFEGDPDALLALVRNALRIEAPDIDEVSFEDNEELDDDEVDREATLPEKRPPATEAAVVRRYRSSLLAMLDRGAGRVANSKSDSLRDLTFLEVLRFHERLTSTIVRIPEHEAVKLGARSKPDDEGNVEVPLLDGDQLVQTRWRLLRAYVSSDPTLTGDCASVLMTHLAAAIREREELDDLTARRLDELAYRHADHLLRTGDPTLGALSWLSPQECTSLLEPYAERTDWYAIVDHCEAEGWIQRGDLDLEPFPIVSGRAGFKNGFDSPAWKLLGYSCIAGYEDDEPFAALIHNTNGAAHFSIHCLQVEPTGRSVRGDRIHEALCRRADGRWVCRTFDGFHKSSADRLLEVVGVRRVTDSLGGTNPTPRDKPPSWLPDVSVETRT